MAYLAKLPITKRTHPFSLLTRPPVFRLFSGGAPRSPPSRIAGECSGLGNVVARHGQRLADGA